MEKNKELSSCSITEILAEDPNDLMVKLQQEYSYYVPETIETIDDLKKAGRMLGKLANTYSFLTQVSSYAKLEVRQLKRKKEAKDKIEDAIDRKTIIDTFAEVINLQYKAVSRLLTIKQQINEELKMTDGR